MSVYFVEKKGWRYDFTIKSQRYTQAWFETNRKGKEAEHQKRSKLTRPISTGMEFLALVNLRLDEMKQRLSHAHYMDTVYHARRWAKRWSGFTCSEITIDVITKLRDERSKISNQTANKELRLLHSLFASGVQKEYITDNPVSRVDRLRVEKSTVYVPPQEDINKVFKVASPDQRDYLWCLRDTLTRSREINNLTWDDIDFKNETITLYTRKKRHGTKTHPGSYH